MGLVCYVEDDSSFLAGLAASGGQLRITPDEPEANSLHATLCTGVSSDVGALMGLSVII